MFVSVFGHWFTLRLHLLNKPVNEWNMVSSVLDLPSELISCIFRYLDNDDVFATRLASKYMETSSFSYFGRRFFRKKGYMITTQSIDVLKSIASHEQLRKYVQHVWFNPDCYTFVTPKCDPSTRESEERGRQLDDTANKSFEADEPSRKLSSQELRQRLGAYEACMSDHKALMFGNAQRLRLELTTAFANLPGLQAIGMRRSEEHQPWGWSKLKDAIGEDPRVLGEISILSSSGLHGPTRLFIAIMGAVAATRADVKRLYTDAIEIDQISLDSLHQGTLDLACRSLMYLEINASLVRRLGGYSGDPMNRPDYGEGLLRLFRAAPELQELGLQIFPDMGQRPVGLRQDRSLEQMYPYVAFQKLVNNVQLRHLTRLKLEKITTSPELLEAFVQPAHSSLTSIKIRDTRLLSPRAGDRPWQSVFEFLRDHCTVLEHVLLYHLQYDQGGVSFVEHPSNMTRLSDALDTDDEDESGLFTEYDHIALEANGRVEVATSMMEIVEKHWYHKPIFSYSMDETLWHTDTSDDEW